MPNEVKTQLGSLQQHSGHIAVRTVDLKHFALVVAVKMQHIYAVG